MIQIKKIPSYVVTWYIKPIVHLLLLIPAALLLIRFYQHTLGVNPVETLSHHTGNSGLIILLLTLAISPLIKLTSWHWLMRLRRMLGLYSFAYICAHLFIYLAFDLGWEMSFLIDDLIERRYIWVGFLSWIILLLLAVTSPIWARKLLKKLWQRLHYGVYLAAVLGLLHLIWLTKLDMRESFYYSLALAFLMLPRLWNLIKRQAKN